MPDQTEPTNGAGGQQMPPSEAQQQFVANAQPVADLLRAGGKEKEAQALEGTAKVIANARKAIVTSTTTLKGVDEERNNFIRNAQPVADALRKGGKSVEASQLEAAARVIGQTKGLGPEQAGQLAQPASGQEKTLKEIMDGVFAAIDKDPKLRSMPEAVNLRKASGALEKDGMLNITVRNGVIVSFASNFADNMARTQKVATAPAAATQAPTQRPASTAAIPAVVPEAKTPAVVPPAAPAQAPTLTPPSAPQAKALPDASAARNVAQVAEAPAFAHSVVQTMHRPAQAQAEVLYAAAPPMSDGAIRKDVLKSQAAHNSVFQIQVDAKDANRAILLPAPGADGRLLNSLHDSMDNAYQMSGQPEAGKQFFAVQRPTQLERTPDGWKVTEKGVVGFSATESVYQVQRVMPAQQAAPQAVQQAPQATPFTRADMPEALLSKLGVQVSVLEKSGQLEKLLQGKKTDLIEGFSLTGASGEHIPFSAKLVMHRDENGAATLKIDLPKRDLVIPKEIMGKTITPAMQVELQKNGVLPITPGFTDGRGQPFSAYLGVDKQMNRVVAVRPETMALNMPKEVLGVKLDPEVSRQLLEGRAAKLVGMKNSKEQVFDATVQLDPVKRQLTFREVQPHQVEQVQQVQQRRRGLGT